MIVLNFVSKGTYFRTVPGCSMLEACIVMLSFKPSFVGHSYVSNQNSFFLLGIESRLQKNRNSCSTNYGRKQLCKGLSPFLTDILLSSSNDFLIFELIYSNIRTSPNINFVHYSEIGNPNVQTKNSLLL